jgi:hypothetical protein
MPARIAFPAAFGESRSGIKQETHAATGMADLGRVETGGNASPVTEFFRARWQGEVSLGLLIWRDMLLVASALNATASMTALGLLALDAPPLLALPVHFALVPYNIFLTLSIWRTAERTGGSTVGYMLVATFWLVLVTVI